MKVTLTLTIEGVTDGVALCSEIATFERTDLSSATLGLSLAEAKTLLANSQKALVEAQVAEYSQKRHVCPHCSAVLSFKGSNTMVVRTLPGKLRLASPRFYTCACQSQSVQQQSFSPLAAELAERSTPELRYLQSKWSAMLSYGATAELLAELLPLEKPISTAVLSRQVQQVAERVESELGAEQFAFIEGCPREWERLPHPEPPLTVGIDGGYVHGREGKNRKAGCFEVIVGKSMPQQGANRRFGFVNGYDTKPKRRLYEVLKSQGMQENQQITFLSDGGDTVRDLQLYLNPQAEHLLDWFHAVRQEVA